jgi:plasmid stability protein
MEEEARRILQNALSQQENGGLGCRIRERFATTGGVELALPARSDEPRTPNLD